MKHNLLGGQLHFIQLQSAAMHKVKSSLQWLQCTHLYLQECLDRARKDSTSLLFWRNEFLHLSPRYTATGKMAGSQKEAVREQFIANNSYTNVIYDICK